MYSRRPHSLHSDLRIVSNIVKPVAGLLTSLAGNLALSWLVFRAPASKVVLFGGISGVLGALLLSALARRSLVRDIEVEIKPLGGTSRGSPRSDC
jgi:hypothetical protein